MNLKNIRQDLQDLQDRKRKKNPAIRLFLYPRNVSLKEPEVNQLSTIKLYL